MRWDSSKRDLTRAAGGARFPEVKAALLEVIGRLTSSQ